MPYGTARPSSLIRKSWTRTSSGWPWGYHSWPPVLKSPTSSFFFVSTEITGCCSASAAETLWLMSANCASRSGWLLPSLVLQLACRLNFCCFSSSPTTVWLIRWPRAASSLASRRRLLQVQRSGAIGSPRSLGATSASRSSSRAASVATSGLRPPPGRRTRSASGRAAVASSFKPRPIVLTAMPVARDTAAIPPYPAVRASVAANSRRLRSSRWGNSKVKRARMPVGSIIPTRYGSAPLPRIQPSTPIHLFPDSHLVPARTRGLPAAEQGLQLADDAAAEQEHAEHEDDALDDRDPGAQRREVILHRGDHERPDDRAEHGSHAANQRHEHDFARHAPMHVGERGELEHDRLRGAGQSGERRREHEHHELVLVGAVAERRGARFVVPNGLQHLSERRVDDPVDEKQAREEDRRDDIIQRQ